MTYTTEITGCDFFGEDFVAYVTYDYTPGSSGGYWEAPYGSEIDIHRISIARDLPGKLGPKFELTGALFWDFHREYLEDCARYVRESGE